MLATIDMRAVPHWMPWAEGGRSLSTFIMSIHHLDTFRYWLGDPDRVLASTRPDPRTKFAHDDGVNLFAPVVVGDADGAVLGSRAVRHALKSAGCTYCFQRFLLAVYVHPL